MVWISESLPFKHSYSKATLWIYFISSSFFSPLPPMSVLVDLCLFLCFRDDLESHYIPVPHETFVGHDETIVNVIGLTFLQLVLTPTLSHISSLLIRYFLV
jgi:hypothetical protein